MNANDTIVAISTPPGRGGIGIVRLSGPASVEIARGLFMPGASRAGNFDFSAKQAELNQVEPNQVVVGHVIDAESRETVDTAVLTYFKGPKSYTGEDVVEISCHGSPVVLALVLNLALALGARIAEPGEFTMRAFLNHRIDLAQAQAVRDLIDSQTSYQARLANRQLDGALTKRIGPLKDALVDVIVHLESSIEFVEDDISPETRSVLIDKLSSVSAGLCEIGSSFALGRYVRQGFGLAIVGRPNVGKSSIFNRLIGADRAIVTEVPGTTRDALHESTSIRGIPVRLIDTAGIRETADLVESIGITRTREAIADADIQLLVLDASEPLTGDDATLIHETPALSRIILLNKSDLPQKLEVPPPGGSCVSDIEFSLTVGPAIPAGNPITRDLARDTVIRISALTGDGFDALADHILGRLGGSQATAGDDIMITDARQHQAIQSANAALTEVRNLMIGGELEEILLLKLRAALQAIGEISGETLTEDILSQIFSTFCIGK
jgi:tRNA modification GTPase